MKFAFVTASVLMLRCAATESSRMLPEEIAPGEGCAQRLSLTRPGVTG
jgi:hypothetical protein